ncbi:MAG: YbfB/YjiJ family MFS transporter [Magnetococcales bacterium]|nr:YbfB/YjiJ family MFS transporter [Magnetococcales bacterium]
MKFIVNNQVILAGIIINMVSMGIARFAYTPLLPAMQMDGLSFEAAGLIASVNYLGYLLGAGLTILVRKAAIQRWLLRFGLFFCLVTTLGMGVTDSVAVWTVLRFFAGVGSALGMVLGSALVLRFLHQVNEPHKIPLQFGGVGLGMALSGVISLLFADQGDWRLAWLILGGFSLITVPFALWRLEKNSVNPVVNSSEMAAEHDKISLFVWFLIAAYFLEGLGYVVTGTFLPTIVRDIRGLEGLGDTIWILVGLAAAPSCLFWAKMAKKYGDTEAIMMALLAQSLGVVLPAITQSAALNLLGAVLYGGTFLGIVSMTLSLGGRMSQGNPARIMGILTLVFALGQVLGPLYAVALTEWQGHYDGTLFVTGLIVLLACGTLWWGRHLAPIRTT